MKKVLCLLAVVLMCALSVVPAFGAEKKDYSHLRGTEINVYNWGEYISDGSDDTMNVNALFEKETGIKVNYTTFDSNENMYNKLKSGGADYDIVIPSDYMIERLIQEELVQKIDFSNIPNYCNILPEYKNLYFDPDNEYSVPYNVGMVGVIYNTKAVEGNPDSWGLMWDEKYSGQIMNFNNPRDAFATAQWYGGYDINSTNGADWDAAYELLKAQKPLVQSYVWMRYTTKWKAARRQSAHIMQVTSSLCMTTTPTLRFITRKREQTFLLTQSVFPKAHRIKRQQSSISTSFFVRMWLLPMRNISVMPLQTKR